MTDRKVYIGVDPGVNGGLVALSQVGETIKVSEMPDTNKGVFNWLAEYRCFGTTVAIETISPAIGIKNDSGKAAGKSQMSKLYGSYRALLMALDVIGLRTVKVKTGEVWRSFDIAPKNEGETRSKWKGRLKEKAQSIFPRIKVTLDTSDALLFAEWCRRKHEGFLVSSVAPIDPDSEVCL